MRISDWSSDVCSSDLDGDVSLARHHRRVDHVHRVEHRRQQAAERYLGERPGVEVGDVALVLDGHLRQAGVGELPCEAAELLGELDRKSTRLNSSHYCESRMPSAA